MAEIILHKDRGLGSSIFKKLKSHIIDDENSNFMYKIYCEDCGVYYIGQTSQYTKKRKILHEQNLRTKIEDFKLKL